MGGGVGGGGVGGGPGGGPLVSSAEGFEVQAGSCLWEAAGGGGAGVAQEKGPGWVGGGGPTCEAGGLGEGSAWRW